MNAKTKLKPAVEGRVPGEDDQSAKRASQSSLALGVYSLLLVSMTAFSWTLYELQPSFLFRPLFDKGVRLNDLISFIGRTAHLYHSAANLKFNYPAPAAFVYKFLLYCVPGHPVAPYMVLVALSMAGLSIAAWIFCRPKQRLFGAAVATALIATALLNHPLIWGAYVGNIEWTQWALSAAGLWFLLRGKTVPAAVLIGLAASIKPFPILFLLLFIRRRRFGAAGLGLATMCLTMLAALVYLGPNPVKAYRDMKPGVDWYMQDFVENLRPPDEARFDHSLLDGMKSAALVRITGLRPREASGVIYALRAQPGGWPVARRLAQTYPWIAVPAFGLVLLVFYNKPLLNQLTALAVVIAIFPPLSAEYTLLSLCIPFWAFVVFLSRDVVPGRSSLTLPSMYAYLILFALSFAPMTPLEMYAGDMKLLLCLALLVVAACVPLRSEYFEGPHGELGGLPVADFTDDQGRSDEYNH